MAAVPAALTWIQLPGVPEAGKVIASRYKPSATSTCVPAAAWLTASWMVLYGRAAEPFPPGEALSSTYNVADGVKESCSGWVLAVPLTSEDALNTLIS